MSAVALFDSLSHPTLSGDWFGRGIDASFETLTRNMRAASFGRACAVGLAGHDGYAHQAFAERCRPFEQLVPIAGVVPKSAPEIDRELDAVRDLGFRGIKLHPRASRFGYDDPRLAETFAKALKSAPDTRLVLLHGGTVELMRWMQFARHTPQILFDISFTLMRYRGSSLDADLAWLFEGFSNRTCIGTDHPEFCHADVRDRFMELSARATSKAARNIGGLNLARFLGVEIT
jgi:predicted TIM-barrel fold metal-dependent hydrolase